MLIDGMSAVTDNNMTKHLEDALRKHQDGHLRTVRSLNRTTSWIKRIKYGSKPWSAPDKERMEEILRDIVFWNDGIHSMLPGSIRMSVADQGVNGFFELRDTQSAEESSRAVSNSGPPDSSSSRSARGETVSATAELYLLRTRLPEPEKESSPGMWNKVVQDMNVASRGTVSIPKHPNERPVESKSSMTLAEFTTKDARMTPRIMT
jgi:hypothetical protein